MGDLARYIEAEIERLSTLFALVGRVLTPGSLYSAGLRLGRRWTRSQPRASFNGPRNVARREGGRKKPPDAAGRHYGPASASRRTRRCGHWLPPSAGPQAAQRRLRRIGLLDEQPERVDGLSRLRQRNLAPLEAEPTDPPHGGSFRVMSLSVEDEVEEHNIQSSGEVDRGKLGDRGLDEREVTSAERVLQPAVVRSP